MTSMVVTGKCYSPNSLIICHFAGQNVTSLVCFTRVAFVFKCFVLKHFRGNFAVVDMYQVEKKIYKGDDLSEHFRKSKTILINHKLHANQC